MARTRSPNYPAINLGEAIDCARKIFAQEHFHKASDETIAQDLGYTGLNGRSIGIISALKKYGLLVPEADGFRISDDAQAILEFEPTNQERLDALNRAAFSPSLFHDLHEEFGDTLPSEGNLRQFLIKRKFHPEKANDVVQLYRDTLELVTQADRVYYEAKHLRESAMRQAQAPTQRIQPVGIPSAAAVGQPTVTTGEGIRFNISENAVSISYEGAVTQELITKLMKYLEISKDDFPSKKDRQNTPINQEADA